MSRTTWPSWVTSIVGVWLIIAPFSIGYAATSARATGEDVLAGIVIAALSTAILGGERPKLAADWAMACVGVWMLAAPFVLDYRGLLVPLANDVIAGVLTVTLAVVQVTLDARDIEQPV